MHVVKHSVRQLLSTMPKESNRPENFARVLALEKIHMNNSLKDISEIIGHTHVVTEILQVHLDNLET